MTILERTKAPAIRSIDNIDLKQGQKKTFTNGLELYTINAGSEEVVKIEWFFLAGSWLEEKPLVAVATNHLLVAGTKKYSAQTLAQKIDFYGATLRTYCTDDTARITLYCLNKYLDQLLPLVQEILTEANFPENEINIFAQNRVNRLKVNNTKNEYVARNTLDQALFGPNHPYGYYPKSEDYLAVNQSDIKTFYNTFYQMNNCKIIASGKIPSHFENLIETLFGKQPCTYQSKAVKHPLELSNEKNIFNKLPNAVQAGIAIGKPMINKTHQDYAGVLIANTILGGYFGSRLMSKIREDKGYTYGIYSTIIPYRNACFTYLATEVAKDVHVPALKEIKSEINRLSNSRVEDSELDLVRNYLLGNFLSSIDGPFALADRLKSIWYHDLDYSYFDNYIETIKNISADNLLELYQKYFNYEEYTRVVIA